MERDINLLILSNLNKFPGFTIAALNPRHTTWILLKALSRRFFQIQVCHGRRSCRRRHYHRMLLKSELIWIGRINHNHLNCLTIRIIHKTFLDFIGISGKLQKALWKSIKNIISQILFRRSFNY